IALIAHRNKKSDVKRQGQTILLHSTEAWHVGQFPAVRPCKAMAYTRLSEGTLCETAALLPFLSLPLADHRPEVPRYEGYEEAFARDVRLMSRGGLAEQIGRPRRAGGRRLAG